MDEIENLCNKYFSKSKIKANDGIQAIIDRLMALQNTTNDPLDSLRIKVALAHHQAYCIKKNLDKEIKTNKKTYMLTQTKDTNPIISELEKQYVMASQHLMECQKSLNRYVGKNNVVAATAAVKHPRQITEEFINSIRKNVDMRIISIEDNVDKQISAMQTMTERQVSRIQARAQKQIDELRQRTEIRIKEKIQESKKQITDIRQRNEEYITKLQHY